MKSNAKVSVGIFSAVCGALGAGVILIDRSVLITVIFIFAICLACVVRYLESQHRNIVWPLYGICVFCLLLCTGSIRQTAATLLDYSFHSGTELLVQQAVLAKQSSSAESMLFQTAVSVLPCLLAFLLAMKNIRVQRVLNRVNMILAFETPPKGIWGTESDNVLYCRAREKCLDFLSASCIVLFVLFIIQTAVGTLNDCIHIGVSWKIVLPYNLSSASLNIMTFVLPLLLVHSSLKDQVPVAKDVKTIRKALSPSDSPSSYTNNQEG